MIDLDKLSDRNCFNIAARLNELKPALPSTELQQHRRAGEIEGYRLALLDLAPLVEIAKAAKVYVDGTIAASGSLSELGPEEFFGYLCDADREAHDRLASLVRQHLLPPSPSQPEEQAR